MITANLPQYLIGTMWYIYFASALSPFYILTTQGGGIIIIPI